MKKLLIISLLGLFIMAACNKNENIGSIIDKKEYSLSTNSKITIGFDNGSVFGSGGVNRYMGSYTIKDNKITFSMFGATMMMGQKEDMDNETNYLKSFPANKPIDIKVENNNLIIGEHTFIPKQ